MNKPSNIRSLALSLACTCVLSACSTTAQVDESVNTPFSGPTAVATRSIERDRDGNPIVVSTANPNKRFVLTPLGEPTESVHIELSGSDYIKVIGSYFPKVVYRAPQPDAKLLMRVAPGTTFPLEKLDDGWYRVSTDKGIGFLRTEDGEPTSTEG